MFPQKYPLNLAFSRTNICCVSGGAGGKGTWGAPGDELFADGSCRDKSDPNYDSDTQVFTCCIYLDIRYGPFLPC